MFCAKGRQNRPKPISAPFNHYPQLYKIFILYNWQLDFEGCFYFANNLFSLIPCYNILKQKAQTHYNLELCFYFANG